MTCISFLFQQIEKGPIQYIFSKLFLNTLAFSFSVMLLQFQGFLASHGLVVVALVLVLMPELAWLMLRVTGLCSAADSGGCRSGLFRPQVSGGVPGIVLRGAPAANFPSFEGTQEKLWAVLVGFSGSQSVSMLEQFSSLVSDDLSWCRTDGLAKVR